jgi:hypothetical protein
VARHPAGNKGLELVDGHQEPLEGTAGQGLVGGGELGGIKGRQPLLPIEPLRVIGEEDGVPVEGDAHRALVGLRAT